MRKEIEALYILNRTATGTYRRALFEGEQAVRMQLRLEKLRLASSGPLFG
jgi:hypothetical protein